MKVEYRCTILQQVLVLIPFFIINVALIGVYIYLFGINTITSAGLIFGSIILIVSVFPVIILHLQYLAKNRKLVLIIEPESRRLALVKDGKVSSHSFDEIQKLEYFATYGHISKAGSSLWYPFDPYRFYKIHFSNNSVSIITCLMINNIENELETQIGIKAEWKFRGIPFIY